MFIDGFMYKPFTSHWCFREPGLGSKPTVLLKITKTAKFGPNRSNQMAK